ncbi:hypothetical protein [Sandarakinorhabdus limnophila]|uniref:hypothetical protein n=1 Tax=Sandarakinorhabdus limnophila TaxID=210512 RepID=UPI0026EF178A|nr:hypothetical protein [Sandarakinorhabdus limnophila]MCM0033466.1 hypothetical protein [Sandarakinorhabdus limnophila]
MKTVANGLPVDEAKPQAFHVELTPVAPAPLFHALHGTVPAAPVPHLPSQIEDAINQPLPKR